MQVFSDGQNSFGMGVVPSSAGLEIVNLRSSGIAALSGLEIGDVLISVAGNSAMSSEATLFKVLRDLQPGAVTEITYAVSIRDKKHVDIIEAGDQPSASPTRLGTDKGSSSPRRGKFASTRPTALASSPSHSNSGMRVFMHGSKVAPLPDFADVIS